MRIDKYVYNESSVLSLLSPAAMARAAEDATLEPSAYAERDEAILVGLGGDDSTIVRVIVGESLSPEEASQWVTRFTARLDLSGGSLVVAAGFDGDLFAEYLEDGDALEDEIHEIEVPAGRYRVDVYGHVASMAVAQILEDQPLAIGAWFRRDHPGAALPGWLANRVWHEADELDPQFAHLWQDTAASIEAGSLQIDSATGYLGYVIHLRSDDGVEPDAIADADGIVSFEATARDVSTLPAGIASTTADPDLVSTLASLRDEDD